MKRVERVEGRTDGQVGEGECSVAVLLEGFWLPARTVFVFRVILHVTGPDALGLIDERTLVHLSQHLPFRSKSF